ncbi:hypothetical protein [Pyxidicoccus xibeiensis]|uniref:hypothetical protein n=1 Tax=Pyxidicoccus xibeiensis TaxID=2906759 RepID=UPI0020A7CCDF|nr:hypothetical protein [Pyxidicoccus xibeiensis]MCP3144551.1 hypothetical protein [Pyxidicoccus xibeiensis]
MKLESHVIKTLLAVMVASFPCMALGQHAPPKNWRSPEGYQQAKWGMTMAEVKKVIPDTRRSDATTLALESPVAGFGGAMTFLSFQDDRLWRVFITIDCKPTSCASMLNTLTHGLERKYGKAQRQSEDGLTHLWSMAETEILLQAKLRKEQPWIGIWYESLRLRTSVESSGL